MSEIKPAVYIGCKTSHGGVVKTGAMGFLVEGSYPAACVGDIVSCPIHGDNAIVPDKSNATVDGRYVARDGWKTACGSILLNPQLPGETAMFSIEDSKCTIFSPLHPENHLYSPDASPVHYDQRIYVRGPDGLAIVG